MAKLLSDFLQEEIAGQPMVVGRGVLPAKGKLVMGAPPKTGKSFVVMNMALDLALGQPLFNAHYDAEHPVFPVYKKNRVLYLENEIGEINLQKRFRNLTGGEALGVDLFIKSRDMKMRMDDPEGCISITKEIAEIRPDVVIIDPLAQFHLADENSAQEMGAVMRQGDHWIEDYGCSIIYVHHIGHINLNPKDIPRQGGAKLRGSTAIFGAADSVMIIERKSSKNNKQPLLELSFDLRHDEPMGDVYIRHLSSGLMKYEGENLSKPAERDIPPLKKKDEVFKPIPNRYAGL